MEKIVGFIVIFLFIISSSGCEKIEEEPVLAPSPEGECGEVIPGIINVKFKEGYDLSTPKMISKTMKSIGDEDSIEVPKKIQKAFFPAKKGTKNEQAQKKIGLDRWIKLIISQNTDLEQELIKWRSRPEVEQASLDYYPCLLLTPNDNPGRYKVQWYHNNTGDNLNSVNGTVDGDIDTPEAWEVQTGNITIAVPDTSIFWHHEDLIKNIWQNLGEDADGDGKVIQPNGTDYIYYTLLNGSPANRSYTKYIFDPDDINGVDDDDWDNDPTTYIDDFIGWDFLDNDNEPNYELSDSLTYQWHGTQTAGSAAAKGNNSVGGAGVCWDCKIMAMRRGVSNSYAIQYAIENGAKVISMSWISYYSGLLGDALDYAHELDVVLLAGAGNYASDTGGLYNSLCFNENIICVAGSTIFDTSWYSSSYILEKGKYSDFGSPSSLIFSTVSYNHPLNIYVSASGTSLGTPIAAGVVALMLSENPNLSADEVKSILLSSTDPFLSVASNRYAGVGRLNADKALNLTLSAKEYGSFPVSIINEYDSHYVINNFNIIGTANSPNFSKYEVLYSPGHYTENWTSLGEFSTPVENSLLYSLSLFDFQLGEWQFKVIVTDTNNQSAYDITQLYFETMPSSLNQSLELKEGWNLFSPHIGLPGITSESLDSFLVAGYEYGEWKIDLSSFEGDSFSLHPWKGYCIYSKENKTLLLNGSAPSTNSPSLNLEGWSLVSFNETGTFANIFDPMPQIRIFNLSIQNNSFYYQNLEEDEILTKGELYWITLNPELSPPRA
jgi:subtilisin family serine protease